MVLVGTHVTGIAITSCWRRHPAGHALYTWPKEAVVRMWIHMSTRGARFRGDGTRYWLRLLLVLMLVLVCGILMTEDAALGALVGWLFCSSRYRIVRIDLVSLFIGVHATTGGIIRIVVLLGHFFDLGCALRNMLSFRTRIMLKGF